MLERVAALTSLSKRLRFLGVPLPSLRDLRLREGLCAPSSSESSGKSSDKSSSELASESGSGSFFRRNTIRARKRWLDHRTLAFNVSHAFLSSSRRSAP